MKRRIGFSLMELLVVVAVIALLAGMLLATIGMVRTSSRATVCASNLRQIVAAGFAYTTDNEGFLPPAYDIYTAIVIWDRDLLKNYLTDDNSTLSKVFLCPDLKKLNFFGRPSTYGWNANLGYYDGTGSAPIWRRRPVTTSTITTPASNFLVVTEGNSDQFGGETGTMTGYHAGIIPECATGTNSSFLTWVPHRRSANVAYLDGHVARLAKTDFVWDGLFTIAPLSGSEVGYRSYW